MKTSCSVPALPGAKITPCVAIDSSPSSRSLLAKYFAIAVGNTFDGSCP